MRFIDTDRFSPVVYANDMPQMGTIAYKQWWSKQRRRCIFGYFVENAIEPGGDAIVDGVDAIWYEEDGHEICFLPEHNIKIVDRKVHICGMHYFYLNFWVIFGLGKGDDVKHNVKPRFIDLDFLVFWSLVRMFVEKADQMFFKARQKGFSEKMACVIAWVFLFIRNSISCIVAGEDKYNEHTMQNTLRGLDNLFDTEFYKRRSPNRSDFVKATYEETIILPDGTKVKRKRGSGSEIYSYSAKNNPQVLSRLSPTFVLYEEMGKWQKGNLTETRGFVDPSLYAEGKKTGYQVFVGTGGDVDESVADVMEMFDSPAEFNLITYANVYEDNDGSRIPFFIPGWWYSIIDSDGNSLKQQSIKKILEDRNSKEKTKNRAITMMPLTPSEGFMITGGGYFPPELIEQFNIRLNFIRNNKQQDPTKTGNLYWNDERDWSKGCYFRPGPDSEGNEWITIFEEPQKDENGEVFPIYFPGTDSYDRTEANTSTSKGSMYVFKGFQGANSVNKMWVGRIFARPTEAQGGNNKFYELTMLLSAYFGMAKNLVEFSNILIFSYYESRYATNLLKERPQFVNANWIIDSKMGNKWGIEPSTKPHWLSKLRSTLREDNFALVHKMWDKQQLLEYIQFRYDPSGKKYNSDVTIASALSVVNYEDSDELIGVATTPAPSGRNPWACHEMDESGEFAYEDEAYGGDYNDLY